MSQEDLERLLAQERELKAKLEAITSERARLEREEKEREAAEARAREMEQPVTVIVRRLSGGSLVIESKPNRSDVLEILRGTPGRSFQGYAPEEWGKNLIPIAQWEGFVQRLALRPNITLTWDKGVREDLEWWLNAPPWLVDVHPSRRHFIAAMGPRQSQYHILSTVPGGQYDWESKTWKLPLSEGWRIFQALEKIDGVVYTDAAQAIIFAQVEQRIKLDEIAKKEDSDHPIFKHLTRPVFMPQLGREIPFREALKPFQRTGIEFLYVNGGRALNSDATGLGKTWQTIAYAEIRRKERPDFQTIAAVKSANIKNWVREIERLTGETPVVCEGGQPDYFLHIQKLVDERVPYVLISIDTLGIKREVKEVVEGVEKTRIVYPWVGVIKSAKPDMLLVDEAHLIKNPDAYRSKAVRLLADIPHIIPMTASPVLNRTEELWPLLYLLDPEMFKVHDQFIQTYTHNGTRPRNTQALHDLMRPMFIRRLKKDVQKDLPPINRITRYHDLSDKAKVAYEDVLKGIYTQLAEFDPAGQGGETMNVMSILAQITRLKQVCAADKVEYTADLATDLIDEANGGGKGKVLIFSQFKGTALAIAQRLGGEAVCTVKRTPTGFESLGASERDDLFEDARHNPDVRFIVTTEAAKEGHNLEFCDWVIFNDPFWTPAGHDQCEGRAYGRLANPHVIDSFYIVADVDVERWIMQLLDKKLAIIQEAVENIESTRDIGGSIGMELIKKMKEEMYRRAA